MLLATWIAAFGAFGSMIAAWVLVKFTKSQLNTIILDYLENRVEHTGARFQMFEDTKSRLSSWSEQLEQENDRLSGCVEAIKDAKSSSDFEKEINEVSETSITLQSNADLIQGGDNPFLALRVSSLHKDIQDQRNEISKVKTIYSTINAKSAGQLEHMKSEALSYLGQIQSDLDTLLDRTKGQRTELSTLQPNPRTVFERAKQNYQVALTNR